MMAGDEDCIDPRRLTGIIAFVQAAEQLKDTLRSGRTAQGRPESTAEHSWRLCLMVMMFERELAGYDLLRLLKLCLVHDLGEAIHGDVPAVEQHNDPDRPARERAEGHACAPLRRTRAAWSSLGRLRKRPIEEAGGEGLRQDREMLQPWSRNAADSLVQPRLRR